MPSPLHVLPPVTGAGRGGRPSAPHLPVRLADEVADALASGAPVVALESHVVANGLPAPRRYDAAIATHARVRAAGAVPATIAVVDGVVTVGLDDDTLVRLSAGVAKLGTRDLGAALARGASGATTISATMALAELVGIDVVASAGLGGVHRGYEETLDVSADLHQLSTSRVVAVSAGIKSVLDVARTLEHLETHGVPVYGLRHRDFPGFYCRTTGHLTADHFDDVDELARAVRLHRALPGSAAVLVTHPISPEAALDPVLVEDAIESALRAAAREAVTGPAVTNFLTARVSAATGGAAARANEAVVVEIAGIGAEVAAALVRQRTEEVR